MSDIKRYYEKKDIVKKYIKYRFGSPIGRMEHENQVKAVQEAIDYFDSKSVLEIAPGPARITKFIRVKKGTAMDYSNEMLLMAKKEMKGAKYTKNWKFIQGDFFKKAINNKFDLIYSFRFVFHFKKQERYAIFKKANSLLKKNGIFIFEIRNKKKAEYVKKVVNTIHPISKNYPIYQKFHTPKEIHKELKDNGFEIVKLIPNISHFFTETALSKIGKVIGLENLSIKTIKKLEKIRGRNPLYFTVVAKKI